MVTLMSKKVLFVCSHNKLRSPTAEAVFAGMPGIEVDSGGLNPEAEVPLSEDQVEWADLILVMETGHRKRLNRMFGHLLAKKKLAVLDIPDDYDFMEPALVEQLKTKCARHLRSC